MTTDVLNILCLIAAILGGALALVLFRLACRLTVKAGRWLRGCADPDEEWK